MVPAKRGHVTSKECNSVSPAWTSNYNKPLQPTEKWPKHPLGSHTWKIVLLCTCGQRCLQHQIQQISWLSVSGTRLLRTNNSVVLAAVAQYYNPLIELDDNRKQSWLILMIWHMMMITQTWRLSTVAWRLMILQTLKNDCYGCQWSRNMMMIIIHKVTVTALILRAHERW